MDKFVTRASPERVTLADAFFHFKGCNPSEGQAKIDLVSVLREKKLDLRVGKVREFPSYYRAQATELRPGETSTIVLPGEKLETNNEAIFEAALPDLAFRFRMEVDWEFSRAFWRRTPPHSSFEFDDITVARDQVLKLRPPPAVAAPAPITEPRRGGGRPGEFNWDKVFAHFMGVLHREGWPDIKPKFVETAGYRELAKKTCDACAEAGMTPSPEVETVRKKLAVWLREIG